MFKISIGLAVICFFILLTLYVILKANVKHPKYVRSYDSRPNFITSFTYDLVLSSKSEEITTGKTALTTDVIRERSIFHMQKKTGRRAKNTNCNVNHRNFLVNYSHKLLYCWIHKVASTTFTAVFSFLAGRLVRKNYYREINILSTKSNEELENIIYNEKFMKFLVVRHPFERLVSAYRDRIEDNSRFTTQAWLHAPKILSRRKRKLNHNDIFDRNNGMVLKIIPTFQEFVTWLISEPPSSYDSHWIRYHDQCMPYKIQYNVTIKLESLLDKEMMMNVTVLRKLGKIKHLQKTEHGRTTFKISCDYFKNVKFTEIERLYKIYEIDFVTFDYLPDAYYECSKYFNHSI